MPPHATEQLQHAHQASTSSLLGKCLPSSNSSRAYTQEDFRVLKSIGHGDMGTVFLVAFRGDNTTPYAMKVMKKEVLAARDNFHRAQTEREILKSVSHPFLPRLFAHFETEKHTFLITNYCSGGDLNVLRQRQPDKRFSENSTRFYAAEVLLALEYLHDHGIIYRDLKPENILVQESGHVMLTDFDLSLIVATKRRSSVSSPCQSVAGEPEKTRGNAFTASLRSLFSCGFPSWLELPRLMAPRKKSTTGCKGYSAMSRIFPRTCSSSSDCMKSNSFVGTEEYVAPEVVWGSGHGMPVDWWTFGIFLYEMVYAKTPFKGSRRKDTFYNILCKEVELPGSQTPLKDLISRLLIKDPELRLGSKNGANDVKNHAFFRGVRWEEVELITRPPVIPAPFLLTEFERGRTSKEVEIDEEFVATRKKKKEHEEGKEVIKQLEEVVAERLSGNTGLQDVEICSCFDKYATTDSEFSVVERLGAGEQQTRTSCDKAGGEGDGKPEDEFVVFRTSSLVANTGDDGQEEALAAVAESIREGSETVGLVFHVSEDAGDEGGEDVLVLVRGSNEDVFEDSFDVF